MPAARSFPEDSTATSVDFTTTAELATLKRRSEVFRQVRDFFYARDFWEVETPLLSQESVIDLYLDPLIVPFPTTEGGPRFLQTSPEFGMKRLLASGAQAIFQITKAFRAGESGQRHNPEFTMLEWYRCGDTYEQGRDLLANFIETWFKVPCEQATYRDKFEQFVNLDPDLATATQLWQRAQTLGLAGDSPTGGAATDSLARRNLLNFLWAELVEPNLGNTAPIIIYDWPASESALAKTATRVTGNGQVRVVAERFELYVHGIELANGYHELLDADVLLERNQTNNAARVQLGKSLLPDNSRLLAAMRQGFPACCGVALGLDRLLMTMLNKTHIHDVVAFPWERA